MPGASGGTRADCASLMNSACLLILRIRWYQSRLRTEENDLVTLPNSMLAEKQVLASACL